VKGVGEDQLTVEVAFQLVYVADETIASTTDSSDTLNATAVFHVDYSLPVRGLSSEDLKAFAEVNAVIDALPYWRQLVHSMLPSMGVHKLVVPVFRPPSAISRTGPA
jgi:hypothetical protein